MTHFLTITGPLVDKEKIQRGYVDIKVETDNLNLALAGTIMEALAKHGFRQLKASWEVKE